MWGSQLTQLWVLVCTEDSFWGATGTFGIFKYIHGMPWHLGNRSQAFAKLFENIQFCQKNGKDEIQKALSIDGQDTIDRPEDGTGNIDRRGLKEQKM